MAYQRQITVLLQSLRGLCTWILRPPSFIISQTGNTPNVHQMENRYSHTMELCKAIRNKLLIHSTMRMNFEKSKLNTGTRHKRVYTLWFCWYEILIQWNLTDDDRNQKLEETPIITMNRSQWVMTRKGSSRTFYGDRSVLYLYLSCDYSSICIGKYSAKCALKTRTWCNYCMYVITNKKQEKS